MPVFRGNTNSEVFSTPKNIPCTIKSIVLTAINADVDAQIDIIDSDDNSTTILKSPIIFGEKYIINTDIIMLKFDYLHVASLNSEYLSYYITIE